MTEWLDIVNDQDQVIGKAPREQIHKEGHLHRSAHIVLFNSAGRVFVQLRSKHKDNGAGLWDTSAAGHVDSGESYLDCAVRELAEELAVVVSAKDLESVGRLQPEARNGFEFTEVYSVCSDQKLVLQVEEIDDGTWLMPQELDGWLQANPQEFTDIFRIIWSMIGRQPS